MGISNSAGGKGSSLRPNQVPTEVVDSNWKNIFGEKPKKEPYKYIPPNEEKTTDNNSVESK